MGQKQVGQAQGGLLNRLAYSRVMKHWHDCAAAAPDMTGEDLALLRKKAGSMAATASGLLGRIDRQTEQRFNAADAIDRPLGCDWAWRPQAFSMPVAPQAYVGAASGCCLGEDLTLFHDCPLQQLSLRQIRNSGRPSPFGAELEVFGFQGSFLSLVVDLPPEAVQGFRLHHLVQLGLDVRMEEARPVYCRFNIQHGPNSDQLVSQMPVGGGVVQFDLAYTKLNEKRLEKAWIDLIFEAPAMNKITLQDLTLLRHPRADL
ncbi:DUF6478 family protein [Thioclava sp. GXIMD4216]|uniref:DUF6478 family protein n=1 Tax=Thioclava sp. GXIMD4216 TaxID=3131929 RepID=UPI0030CB2A71